MRPYGSREIVSTFILVAAAMVFLIFTGLYLHDATPRNLVWALLFFGTAALAPAPWFVPPLGLGSLALVVALAPSEATCPSGGLCEPVPFGNEFLVSATILFVAASAGAALRSTVGWRRQRRARAHVQEQMPWIDPTPQEPTSQGEARASQEGQVQARDDERRHQDPDQRHDQ